MALEVFRVDRGGARQIIGVCDDWVEVGPMIYGDRGNIDWEPTYIVEHDKEGGNDAGRASN